MNRIKEPRLATNEWRTKLFGIGLLLIGALFVLRLFHIQVMSHELYASQAEESHIKKFEISAERGEIYVQQKDSHAPVVLNETRYLLYGDPEFVEDVPETSRQISQLTGAKAHKYEKLLERKGRYVVLESRLDRSKMKEIYSLHLKGIGFKPLSHRVYPEDTTGSHLLGFLNAEGFGQYGIEQFYDDVLKGKNGLLNTEVDARGVPLVTASNTFIQPEPGKDLTLTIDKNIQAQAHAIAKKYKNDFLAQSVSILVMDPNSGAIKTMNTYPEFHPGNYQDVSDYQDFMNPVISEAYEPGSIFKIFTMAAGLEEGVVSPKETYFDSGSVVVDGFKIRNAESYKPQSRTMVDVIRSSLNTGSVYVLKELSGGDQITTKGKKILYEYLTNKFRFGQLTGIDLPQEGSGSVEEPEKRSDVGYANMSFGQGLSATMTQMASAVSAIANGGDYYRPYVLDSISMNDELIRQVKPKKLSKSIISRKTTKNLTSMMEQVVEDGSGWRARRNGHRIAGKTGTAQVASEEGGYAVGKYIGSMVGFAPAGNPQYVLIVRVVEPNVYGYAGSDAAGQIFADMNNWLLDYYMIPPDKKGD